MRFMKRISLLEVGSLKFTLWRKKHRSWRSSSLCLITKLRTWNVVSLLSKTRFCSWSNRRMIWISNWKVSIALMPIWVISWMTWGQSKSTCKSLLSKLVQQSVKTTWRCVSAVMTFTGSFKIKWTLNYCVAQPTSACLTTSKTKLLKMSKLTLTSKRSWTSNINTRVILLLPWPRSLKRAKRRTKRTTKRLWKTICT